MKQRETTVLVGILTMLSFALGHATLSVKDFWHEPVIVWMAIVLPTGKNPPDVCVGQVLRYFTHIYGLYVIELIKVLKTENSV